MSNVIDRIYLAMCLRAYKAKEVLKEMWEEEKGGTSTVVIEIVMVGMILVLGFIFRKQIGSLFTNLWNSLVTFSDKPSDPAIGSMSNPFE